MEGLSGKIKFDGAGFRSDFQLDIVELKREGLVQVSSGKKYFKSYKNICRSALGTRAMEPISPVTTRKYPTRLWRVFITRLWLSPPSWWVAHHSSLTGVHYDKKQVYKQTVWELCKVRLFSTKCYNVHPWQQGHCDAVHCTESSDAHAGVIFRMLRFWCWKKRAKPWLETLATRDTAWTSYHPSRKY